MAVFASTNVVPLFRYQLIMADPPWDFKSWSKRGYAKGAKAQYHCTPLDWLKSLNVADMADRNCMLWLWATNPMLPQAFEVMSAWGFTFKTAGHWSKKTKHGKQAFGTGYILRCAGEPFLIGTLGRPKTQVKNVRSVIEGLVREHSRKPEEAYREAERLCGNVPRLELFARQTRKGWDSMGDEATKFDNEAQKDAA